MGKLKETKMMKMVLMKKDGLEWSRRRRNAASCYHRTCRGGCDDRPASDISRSMLLGVCDYSRTGVQRLESGLLEYDTSIYEVSEVALILL
ncbi:hypothetical protein KC19_8G121300 [Ceratodon purpureus]|uniref:Uncharacterized protein n=1 Tax=Ceratodon purpureus TaxID=3225 RepID=A0A8T0GY03_CERPU|nr:hypothetical protein KC19_8G121300 [Ceratodon purpureus]